MDVAGILQQNLTDVRNQMDSALRRSGRAADAVRLVAVTKYARLEWVRELIALGVRDLGESRPQQLVERAEQLDTDLRWHLTGPLQRNKARRTLPYCSLIHSIDSLRLLERLEVLAGELNLSPQLLLQVNISGEEAKQGFTPEELRSAATQLARLQQVQVAGLMTMAPHTSRPEETRPVFRGLRELRDELADQLQGRWPLTELSMGMSSDFAVAIEEGATMVRVGSALFDGLEQPATGENH